MYVTTEFGGNFNTQEDYYMKIIGYIHDMWNWMSVSLFYNHVCQRHALIRSHFICRDASSKLK